VKGCVSCVNLERKYSQGLKKGIGRGYLGEGVLLCGSVVQSFTKHEDRG
jgi:hypothetical protein